MSDMHATSRMKEQRTAEARVKGAGYAHGGAVHSDYESSDDAKADRARVKRAFREHDDQLHGGKRTNLSGLRHGGTVDGGKPERRIDRRARGGGIKGKGHLSIHIHNSNPGERQQAAQKGMQQGMRAGAALGAKQMAARMAGRPPIGGAGAPPPMMSPGAGRPPMGPPGAGMGGAPMGAPMMGGAGALGAGPPRPPQMVADGGVVKVRAHLRRRAGGAVK